MKKILVVLIALLVVLAACKNNSTTLQTDGQVQETSGGEENTQEEGNSVSDFFSKIVPLTQYKIKYDMKTTVNGATSSSTEVMALKGKNMKVDIESDEGLMSTYVLDDKLYTCTTSGEEVFCMEFPTSQEEETAADTTNEVVSNWEGYNLVPKGTRTIAGKLATCFGYEQSGIKTEYCFSADGAPLYIKTESSQGISEMTALEYTKTVSDAEFELPAEPQQMPSFN